MSRLHEIGPAPGATRTRKRVGRGPGSGLGKTAARGHKGQQSRSGYSHRYGHEGGQMPLVRRIPKRGFTNIFAERYVEVNVGRLATLATGSEITPETLVTLGMISRSESSRVKLLGKGELAVALKVKVHAASAGAKARIEAAGGTLEIIGAEA
jgi:large subunit ribosomal protein L15